MYWKLYAVWVEFLKDVFVPHKRLMIVYYATPEMTRSNTLWVNFVKGVLCQKPNIVVVTLTQRKKRKATMEPSPSVVPW